MTSAALRKCRFVLRSALLFVTGYAGAVHCLSISERPCHIKRPLGSSCRRHVFSMALDAQLGIARRFGLAHVVTHCASLILGNDPGERLVFRYISEVGLVLKDVGRSIHISMASRTRGAVVVG